MRLKLLAAALALFAFAPLSAFADPNPGDACANAGEFQRTGGAESSGVGNMMVCSGGTWKALIGFDGTANVNINYAVGLTGDITPAQITANQNNYNPANLATASVLRLSTDASRNVTGLAGGADGRVLSIHNVGTNNVVLKNQDAASTAANRFAFGTDLTIAADQSVAVIYDATSQRWRAAGLPFDSAAAGGACSAGGLSMGGYCWYIGNDNQSCTSVCSTRGGYNAATKDYAGSAGTSANCQAISMAFFADQIGWWGDDPCTGYTTLGCLQYTGSAFRCIGGATTEAGSLSGGHRFCACNN